MDKFDEKAKEALETAEFFFTEKIDPKKAAILSVAQALREAVAEDRKVIKFCRDLASEELPYTKVGTGAEVALRHIVRKCNEAIEEREKRG